LRTKKALSDEELDVAIEVAHIWSLRFHESVDGFSLATTEGVLANISDLSYNDVPWDSVESHITTHPKISRTVATRLKVPCLSEVLKYGALGINDLDDGEFNQREEVADGIRDTLDRYARESTFHEYVANADDCGSASEINFLFDGRTYDSKDVLTEELKALQGPSLLIHNDGGESTSRVRPCAALTIFAAVFTDTDFDGLKHVGRGSKRDDPTTIGKFGRGSHTMYQRYVH
jgi:sacsin